MQIISEYGGLHEEAYEVILRDDGKYDVTKDGVVIQANHDAEGIIRYLSFCLHNAHYLVSSRINKSKNEDDPSSLKLGR